MADKKFRPYGSWKSPITSELIVAGTVGLGDILIDRDDIYWIESRPSEQGRNVIVRLSADGALSDMTPAPLNARTAVHEYGGGSYIVRNGTIYFSNFGDQRLYRQDSGRAPEAITPEEPLRYADAVIDESNHRLICVREDHRSGTRDTINTIVAIDLTSPGEGEMLISGNDFYSSPRLSPDGKQLAWLTWNHPNLPWDGTELWVAEVLKGGGLGSRMKIAGGPSESIFQPEWSPGGLLYFVSDRNGWWNLYRRKSGQIESVYEMQAEFGAPQWVFRMSTYAFLPDDRLICAYNRMGTWRLGLIRDRKLAEIECTYSEILSVRVHNGKAVFCGGSPTESLSIVRIDPATGESEVLRRSSSVEVDQAYISVPAAIQYPTENGLTAHAFFYPPRNKDYAAPESERPPVLVISHGGPTGATTTTLRLSIQYWTSRGIAVLDVNYGGSTGYGRLYRERLNGQWGVVDVDDCVNGAQYLVRQGKVDGNRLIIRGGSAGGYTTLAALTFRDVFKAGASYYGVSDLEVLERDCHKFESQYNRSLIGPYPERQDLYKQRSPIHFTDRLSCPIILFQGLEDKVVPPNQAEMMFEALRKKGLPVAYVPFEGEQHGFRRAENIKRALDGEMYFYSRVFGFDTDVEPDPGVIERFENFQDS